MFTANTMAAVSEALGMALPGSASPPAVDPRRGDLAERSGEAVMRLLEAGLRPRQILTIDAFENAFAVVMALGGSTNAVLHLLAIAHEACVELSLDDFDRTGRRVPHIADMKPHGRYHRSDPDGIGGLPVVMRELLEADRLHGDCLTVTGQTVAENLAALDAPRPDGSVVHPLSEPIHADGGIAVLSGSLAPDGAVVKIAGLDEEHFEGTARVFDDEHAEPPPGWLEVPATPLPDRCPGQVRPPRDGRRPGGRHRALTPPIARSVAARIHARSGFAVPWPRQAGRRWSSPSEPLLGADGSYPPTI